MEYFHTGCRYLDFDGKVLGEASTALGIEKFRGIKWTREEDAKLLQMRNDGCSWEEIHTASARRLRSEMAPESFADERTLEVGR